MLIPPAGVLVGRAKELQTLAELVQRGHRLLTVLGGPGVGKTRLVNEWAQSVEARLVAEGVALKFCDLTEARTIDAACAALAKALSATLSVDASVADAAELIAKHVATMGPSILVLDNFEQLTAESARLLEPLLAAAPQSTVVVTSRERLRLRMEHCLILEPLPGNESVELFYMRARQVRANALTEADAPTVAEIVRRLDGIPLAIELAAARIAVLQPSQLLERLARRFELLTRGARAAPGRHSTLRDAIAWSCDMLTPGERAALWQCAVFRGGFSIEAAEAVLDVEDSVLDMLESLHDKSLLHLDEPGAQNARRFRLLESIRAFAEEVLAGSEEEQEAIATRHAVFFLGAPGSPLPRPGLAQERVELENLMVASERALRNLAKSPAHVDAALRSLLLLDPFYLGSARGRLEPFVRALDDALSASKDLADRALVARAIHTRALTDLVRGRIIDCVVGFQRALDVARQAGARVEEGLALTKLALFLTHGDQADAARELFDEAAKISGEHPDLELAGDLALTRGGAAIWQGRSDQALAALDTAVEIYERMDHPRLLAMAEGQRALALLNLGKLAEAEDALDRALSRVDGTEEERVQGYLLGIFGRVLHAAGRFEEAKASFDNALQIHRAVGDRWSEGVHLGFAAHLALEERDLDLARTLYEQAVTVLKDTGERHYLSIYGAALAAVNAMRGAPDAGKPALGEGIEVLATQRSVRLYAAVVEVAAKSPNARADARALLADDADSLSSRSLDVRIAESVLRRELDEAGDVASVESRRESDPAAWEIGPEARWLKPPGEPAVSLLKSRSLRLILLRLTQQRLEQANVALDVDALFRAGWPGERATKKAAANRVYVSLTKLRNLGLRRLIQSRDGGFLLDPLATVTLQSEPPGRAAP